MHLINLCELSDRSSGALSGYLSTSAKSRMQRSSRSSLSRLRSSPNASSRAELRRCAASAQSANFAANCSQVRGRRVTRRSVDADAGGRAGSGRRG